MAERRLIRPGEYGAAFRRRVEPTIVERRMVAPPDFVLVGKDDYVSRSKFEELNPAEQSYLKKFGVKRFNVEQERGRAEALEGLVLIGEDELISKLEFERLTPAEQSYIKKFGFERWEKDNIIKTGPEGESLSRSDYEKMEPEAQVLIKDVGIIEFNRLIEEAKTKTAEVIQKLGDFIEGDKLSLTGAIKAGFTKVEDFFGWDVTLSDIIEAQRDIKEVEETQAEVTKTRARLSDFIEGDTLRFSEAVAAGFTGVSDYFGWDVTQKDIDAARPLTVKQAYNKLIQEGEISEYSTLITTQKEYEKTGVVEYERLPEPPNYARLESLFLKESENYQEALIKTLNFKWPVPEKFTKEIMESWVTLSKLPPDRQRLVLEKYASYALTPSGEVATKGWKLMPSFITEIGMAYYPYSPGAAIARLGPEASFVASTIEAAKYTLPAVWLLDVMKMKPWQIAVNVAVDLVYIGALIGPKAFRVIARADIRRTTSAARAAGKAKIRMTTALTHLKEVVAVKKLPKGIVAKTVLGKTTVTPARYATLAAKAQAAIQASLKADKAFISRLSLLKDVMPDELLKFQKLSGMKGLKSSIKNINKASVRLDAAWSATEQYTMFTPKHNKAMLRVMKARASFDKALANFYTKTSPRYKFAPSPFEYRGYKIEDAIISARQAGGASSKVKAAVAKLQATPLDDVNYARIAGEAQDAIAASIKADKSFISKLTALKELYPDDIARMEASSGIKGLEKLIRNVGTASDALDKAWYNARLYPIGSPEYIRGLVSVEKARAVLNDAVDAFNNKLRPRHGFGQYAGWSDAILKAEQELMKAQRLAAKAASAVEVAAWDPATTKAGLESVQKWLSETMFDLRQAEVKLANIKTAAAVGREFPPQYANPFWDDIGNFLKQERPPLSPDAVARIREIAARSEEAYFKKMGFRPMREGVAVAIKEKVVPKVESVIVKPKVEIAPKVTAPKVAAPKVGVKPKIKPKVKVPEVKVSAFPGLATPRVKVTTPTETTTVDASEIGRMTPEQFQRLYGSDVIVRAVGVPLPEIDIGIKQWMSPSDAIKAAERINVDVHTKQIVQDVTKIAIEAINKNLTNQEIKTITEQSIKTRIDAITDVSIRTKVTTKLITKIQTRINEKLKLKFRTPIRFVIHIPPIPVSDVVKRKGVYPAGTVVWKQGAFWKIIPPPYNIKKPISSRTPPAGVTVMKGTPQETLAFIGGVIPFGNVAFDLGVTDGYINVKTRRIHFTSDWRLATDVGKRMPSPTKGLSIERAEALGIRPPRITKTKVTTPRRRAEPKVGVVRLGKIRV